MSSKKNNEIIKQEFNFLKLNFGFKLIKDQTKSGVYELLYLNETTGVKIIYEYREVYIRIVLYKLLNGRLEENPVKINQDTILFGFDLDDIITVRNPSALIKPAYEYGEQSEFYNEENGFELYISSFAKNLIQYASDVLIGDFKIFKNTEKIVKERAKMYNKF